MSARSPTTTSAEADGDQDVINDNGGTATAADFTMTVTGTDAIARQLRRGGGARARRSRSTPAPTTSPRPGRSGYTGSYSADCCGLDRQRRDQDLHRHQQRHAAEADRDQARHQRQRRHGDRGRLHLDSVTGNDTPPGNFPGAESARHRGDPGRRRLQRHRDRAVRLYQHEVSADCAGTIANGETKTCTVTNNDTSRDVDRDQARHQRQRRHRDAANFTLDSVTGNDSLAGNFPGAESPGTAVTLDAGAYNVTETGPSGYTSTSYSADCSAGRSPTARPRPAPSPTTTRQPTLIVIKHVINDNGGTATAADFTLDSVTAPTTPPPTSPGRSARDRR